MIASPLFFLPGNPFRPATYRQNAEQESLETKQIVVLDDK